MSVPDKVLNAGIVGAGGAGFPTNIKLTSRVRTYIANGAECEPLLFKDSSLLERYPEEIVSGLSIAMESVGADRGYIAVKEKNKEAIKSIKRVIKDNQHIEIFTLPDFYPIGDEYLLTPLITEKRIPQGGIPPDVDVMVNNIETLYNIHRAVEYREPLTSKFISVIGKVKKPGLYKVPIGITAGEVVKKAELTDRKFTLLSDGLMMGESADMKTPITKTTSALYVLEPLNRVPLNYSLTLEQIRIRARSACEHCRQCTDMCPRYLLGYDIEPHRIIRSFSFSSNIKEEDIVGVSNCCECGICELYACPMDLSPRRVCSYLKTATTQTNGDGEIKEVHGERENRLIPTGRLTMRLGVNDFRVEKPEYYELDTDEVTLPLTQHFGSPSKPIIDIGDEVEIGEVIAVLSSEISSTIHASISGNIHSVDDIIIIRR